MKAKYCQFCGSKVNKLSIMSGSYHSNTCPEPSCPAHGDEYSDEQDNEYEGLSIFTPGETDG